METGFSTDMEAGFLTQAWKHAFRRRHENRFFDTDMEHAIRRKNGNRVFDTSMGTKLSDTNMKRSPTRMWKQAFSWRTSK